MQTLTLTRTEKQSAVTEARISAVILLVDSGVLEGKKTYLHKLCGQSMEDWVKMAVRSWPTKTVELQEKTENLVEKVRPVLDDSEITFVLFSDTPLLQTAVLLQAVEHLQAKGLNMLPLSRGFVFKTEYLKTVGNVFSVPDIAYLFDNPCFLRCDQLMSIQEAAQQLQRRINHYHTKNGVLIIDPETVYIDADVIIDKGAQIGPCAVLRTGSVIGKNAVIGNFVEIKNSKIGAGTKVKHHVYVGDAEIGEKTNIGCGVVFCNYDGVAKHKTFIGNQCFIGANCNLIAPLKVGNNCFIAAGTTLTEDLKDNMFAIARTQTVIKPNKTAGK